MFRVVSPTGPVLPLAVTNSRHSEGGRISGSLSDGSCASRLSRLNTDLPAPESEINSRHGWQTMGRASPGAIILPTAATPAATFAAAFAALPLPPLELLLGDADSASETAAAGSSCVDTASARTDRKRSGSWLYLHLSPCKQLPRDLASAKQGSLGLLACKSVLPLDLPPSLPESLPLPEPLSLPLPLSSLPLGLLPLGLDGDFGLTGAPPTA